MDMKQVAGAWIMGAAIFTISLGLLSHQDGSGENGRASVQMNYTAPARAGQPRSWFEETGSLPPKTAAASDFDDDVVEIDPPDPSDFALASGELIQ